MRRLAKGHVMRALIMQGIRETATSQAARS